MRGYEKPAVLLVDLNDGDVIRTSVDVVIKETIDWDGHFADKQEGEL